jgi:hypothetical protein
MHAKLFGVGLGLLTLLGVSPVEAQQPPPMPPNFNKEAILAQVRASLPEVIANSPEETLEIEGVVTIKYKQIPTSPTKVAEALGKDLGNKGLPPGIDINQYIGMFEKEITSVLNESLADVGSIEAKVPLKVKSKKVPVGTHRFGIVFEGERPKAIKIFNEDEEVMKKPIELRLKVRPSDLQEELSVTLKEPKTQKKGKEEFELRLAFLRFQAKSKSKVKAAPEK